MKPRYVPALGLSLLLPAIVGGEVVERVVAKVNGDIVTLSEFEARQLAAVQQARLNQEQVGEYLRRNNARLLQEAEDELLLVQKANEIDIKVRPEYLKEVVDGIKKENHLDTDQALDEQLRREGLSLEDLKRNVTRQILKRQVLTREVEGKISVTEADARAEYDSHMDKYRKPARVHLQEIVLKAGEDAKAAEIVTRARGGEDFAILAKTYSIARSRESGGELGTLHRGELNADLEKVAFALPDKGVSDPITIGDGIRILRVVESFPESVTSFESARAEITRHLQDQRFTTEYEKYMEGLRKSATIEVRVREVPTEITGSPTAAPALETSPEGEITTTGKATPEHLTPGQKVEPPTEGAPKPSPTPPPL